LIFFIIEKWTGVHFKKKPEWKRVFLIDDEKNQLPTAKKL
jgi:hypothetical protein